MVALAAFAREDFEPRPVVKRLLGPGLAFAAVGGYWLVVLMPAIADYVANPASLAYRGPDRLWADLFGRWPTAVVAIVGAGALGFAGVRSLLHRRMEPMLLIATWALLAWGLLGWSLVSGSATDFPRFATPLILPLVIGAAAAVLWALQWLATWIGDAGERGQGGIVIGVAVVLSVLVAGSAHRASGMSGRPSSMSSATPTPWPMQLHGSRPSCPRGPPCWPTSVRANGSRA